VLFVISSLSIPIYKPLFIFCVSRIVLEKAWAALKMNKGGELYVRLIKSLLKGSLLGQNFVHFNKKIRRYHEVYFDQLEFNSLSVIRFSRTLFSFFRTARSDSVCQTQNSLF